MLWEMDISIISGQMALLHVRLEPGDGFEVYGGTSEDALRVVRQDDEWLVTLDEADVAGRPLVRFNVYARQVSTGREWAIFGGKVLVSQRTATVPGDKLAPVEYFVTVPVVENAVDLTGTAIVTGIVGPRGYSAYEVAVLEGFVGSEAEWLESIRQKTAELAVEQVTPLMERAESAAEESEQSANDADGHKKVAQAAQQGAENEATRSKESADKAEQHENTVRGLITDAAAHEQAAAQSAQDALANQQSAEQAAQDAALAQKAAQTAKTDAEAAMAGAQTAEGNAKASANAAAADKVAAEQAKTDAQAAQGEAEAAKVEAVEKAALLGDAALRGGDNAFTGNNSHSGTEVFNGAVALNGAVDATAAVMQLPAEVLRAMSSWPALVGPLCAVPDDVGLYLGAALEDEVLVMNLPNIKNLKFTATGLMTSTVKRSGSARDGLMLNTAGCGTARVVVSIGPSIFCGNDNWNVYYDCEEMYIFLTSDELGAYALPRSTMKSSASGKSLKKLVIIAPYQATCQQDFFTGCASELEDFVCIMPRIAGFEQQISDGRGRMFRNLRGCRRARIYLPGLVTDLNLPNMQMDADSVVFLLDGLGDVSAAPCVATLGVGAGVAEDAAVQNAVAAAAAKGWTVIFNDNSEAY